jgi:hypothetical protein
MYVGQFGAAALMTLALCACGTAHASTTRSPLVNPATGWAHAGGNWTMRGSIVSYSGSAAAILLSPTRATGGSYSVAASIRLRAWKSTGISENNGFGLLLRASGPTDPTQDTAGLMAGVGKGYMGCDGVYSQAVVTTADVDLESVKQTNSRFHPGSAWRRYRATVRGNTISLAIDGKTLTTVRTSRFSGGTRVGLFSLGSAVDAKDFTLTGR